MLKEADRQRALANDAEFERLQQEEKEADDRYMISGLEADWNKYLEAKNRLDNFRFS